MFKSTLIILTLFSLTFLLKVTTAKGDVEKCLTSIFHMKELYSKDYPKFLEKFAAYVAYSGKSVNDLGNYQGCSVAKGQVYSNMYILYKSDIGVNLGLCLDEYCDAPTLSIISEKAAEFFNTTGPFAGKIPPTSEIKLKFYSVGGYPSTNNAAFIITVIILISCFTLALTGPILSCYKTYWKSSKPNLESTMISQISQPAQDQAPKQPPKPNFFNKLVDCFDITKNFEKYSNTKSYNDDLLIFNGIRVCSFLEVIYGHVFMISTSVIADYLYVDKVIMKSDILLFIYSNLYAVDVFFWLSGFFMAYVMGDPKKVSNFTFNHPFNLFMAFLQRLIRLWPCLIMTTLIFWKITPQLGSGPVFGEYQESVEDCDTKYLGWVLRVLFVDNLTKNTHAGGCVLWAWYLDNDMQIFIYCLLLMAIYAHNAFYGKLSMYLSLLGATIYIIYISVYADIGVLAMFQSTKHGFEFGENFYMKPWTRCPPFILGLIFGIHYREYYNEKKKGTSETLFSKLKLKITQRPWLIWIFYGLGIAIVNIIIWVPKTELIHGRNSWPTVIQNLWNAFVRPVYCFGVGLITIPCMMGSKDFIIKIFGCTYFTFFARITYCCYLVHYMCLQVMIMCTGQGYQWSYTISTALFVLGVVMAVIFASLMNLIIEMPFINLDTLVFNRQHSSSRIQVDKQGQQGQAVGPNQEEKKEQLKELAKDEEKKHIDVKVDQNYSPIPEKQPQQESQKENKLEIDLNLQINNSQQGQDQPLIQQQQEPPKDQPNQADDQFIQQRNKNQLVFLDKDQGKVNAGYSEIINVDDQENAQKGNQK